LQRSDDRKAVLLLLLALLLLLLLLLVRCNSNPLFCCFAVPTATSCPFQTNNYQGLSVAA
jgi:hypothetical protein